MQSILYCFMVTIALPVLRSSTRTNPIHRLSMDVGLFRGGNMNKMDPPVLLFPGLGASRLLNGHRNVYPPSLQDYIFHTKKWQMDIMENRNLTTLPFGHKRSLDMSVSLFSSHRNVYERMIRDPDVHPIPYDFRLIDQKEYMDDLCDRIKTYIEGFQKPVILMCHSSGGLVAHWFLHRQPLTWRKQWIDSVVNINVPFGGTVVVLENCIREDIGVSRIVGKNVFRSLGATVLNMPDTRYLNTSVLIHDGKEIQEYLEFFGLEDIRKRLKQNQDVIDSFKEWTEVETHIVYSTTDTAKMTPTTINVHQEKKTSKMFDEHDWTMNMNMGEGDGVISLESLIVPQIWKATSDLVTFHHVPRSGHSSVLSKDEYES